MLNVVLIVAILLTCFGTGTSVSAQTVVNLQKLVLQPKHTEYVYTRNPKSPAIVDVKSSNPSVATADVYRADRVQIVGVAPGRTDVEFFDSVQRTLYRVPVWVETANATGGGGAGYNPRKTQLPQVVMLVKHTHNVVAPGAGSHQISSVVSSNPSVATARTNTANTIQIYSTALGNTFVDFTDNAKGATYQVPVWVVAKLPGPIGGGTGGGAAPSGGPKGPNPFPTTPVGKKPVGGLGLSAGRLDSCLVGTWRTESVINDFIHWDNGGAGVIMKIKADGSVTMDYDGMQPNQKGGRTITWRGNASGHIATKQGLLTVENIDSSNISTQYTSPDRPPHTGKLDGLGNVLQSIAPHNYTCDGTTLTLKTHVWSSKFRKVE